MNSYGGNSGGLHATGVYWGPPEMGGSLGTMAPSYN